MVFMKAWAKHGGGEKRKIKGISFDCRGVNAESQSLLQNIVMVKDDRCMSARFAGS